MRAAPKTGDGRFEIADVDRPQIPNADWVLVCELAATLTSLCIAADGKLQPLQTVATAPEAFAERNLGGHLALNGAGDRAYVTNRGHDSIAVFDLSDSGELRLLQHVPSGGASPRHFVLLEDRQRLVLANEESGSVTMFAVGVDGLLLPLPGSIAVAGAAFVLEAREPARASAAKAGA